MSSKNVNKKDRKTGSISITLIGVLVVGKANAVRLGQFPCLEHRPIIACITCTRKPMDKGKGVIGNQLDHADLSKIRILLYDINAESCQEILALLCKCPYQAAVWSAREVYETLKSEGHETHIILAEVNLLMANDARMLRYIMRDKKLQQIPVIILTTQDQVPTTIKGMCLGAADYLVKPLHDDELSSLWMYIMHK